MKRIGFDKRLFGLSAFAVVGLLVAGLLIVSGKPSRLDAKPVGEGAVEHAAGTGEIDVKSAMAERALGDPNAPVRIDEYASLSCSHCATFHKETLPSLKKDYIETGKVYFVFNNFPLNAPALDAAQIAHCMPKERYFQFISFLFETQDKWAFESNHLQVLRQNAKLLGANDKLLDNCLGNESLKTALVEKMQDASTKHDIRSTPSFIMNGSEPVSGASRYTDFAKMIDAVLAKEAEKAPE